MRALVLLAVVAPLTGCMSLFCGETTYFSSPPSAVVVFEGEYDAERADEGLRAIPAGEGVARAAPASSDRVRLTFDFMAPCEGPSEEAVRSCSAEKERELTPRVESAAAAFQNATGWTRASDVVWQGSGIGHGDC